jgi:hypothetical protein
LAGEQGQGESRDGVRNLEGHSRIQTTLDLYTDDDLDEIAARDKFVDAMGIESGNVQ